MVGLANCFGGVGGDGGDGNGGDDIEEQQLRGQLGRQARDDFTYMIPDGSALTYVSTASED